MKSQGPLLICSRSFPPKLGGSAILSRNLWGAWPADDLFVITQSYPDDKCDASTVLPGVTIREVPAWWSRYPMLRATCAPLLAMCVQREITRAAAKCRPRALWVNWPTTEFLLGGWWAARQLRLPLYVHMHDVWKTRITCATNAMAGVCARLLQKRVLCNAQRLFAITEEAAAYYRETYGVDSYVLKHCLPDADLHAGRAAEVVTHPDQVIHFAGGIYPPMNLDAMLNLVQAIDGCRSGITLDGYTFHPESAARAGICGPRVKLRVASKADVMAAQRRAAILFLPLAFQSSNPDDIRTVFPTKLLEYFVSGRPILVHAPADSWASRAAKRDGWGEVVDQPDPAALAAAIDALLANEARQRALVSAAFREAENRVASRVVQDLRRELVRQESFRE